MSMAKKNEILSWADVIREITEQLLNFDFADGKAIAEIHNDLCDREVEYVGDSLFERKV